MPKFYFHLSNCDACFRDHIGSDLADIAVAHTRAKRLAHLVMTTSRLANHEPDWRRWTVTVTHDPQGPILIIPFGAFGLYSPAAAIRYGNNATRAALSAFVPAGHIGGRTHEVLSLRDSDPSVI